MSVSKIFAARSANDTDAIVALGMQKVNRLTMLIRRSVLHQVRENQLIDISPIVNQVLAPLMTNVMLASHLAGFRRFRLTLRQSPDLLQKYRAGSLKHPAIAELEPELELALNSPALNNAIKVLKARAGIDIEQLQEQYKTNVLTFLTNTSDAIEEDLRKTMQELTAKGAHVKEATIELAKRFEALGITPANSFSLENMFRTQTQLAFGAGKYQAEQDPAVQEILWGYRYVTVGDDRVREEHAVLEGTQLPKNDPFWSTFYPPNGYSCRCQAIPIFETVEIKKPPTFKEDGITPISPDKGFNFNPGLVFRTAS